MLKDYFTYITGLMQMVIRARNWALRYGTNAVQLLNIAFAVVFTYVFGFADSGVDAAPIYSAFVPFDESRWWLVMPAIIISQCIFMLVKSLRCDVLSGFILLVSVPVWTFVSISFANSGFVNTGSYIYGIWAVTCFFAGWRMMDLYDYKLIVKRRGKCNARVVGSGATSTDHTASDGGDGGRIDGRLFNSTTESQT